MITIKSATQSDFKSILPFFKHYPAKTGENRLNCFLTHNHTNIALDQNKVVGIIQWQLKEDPSQGVAEIEEVFVLDNYRQQHIGYDLLEFTIQNITDYFLNLKITPRKIYLFVSQNNQPAIKLYQKFNFKLISNVGNLFHNSQPELFYCLDI